MSNCFKGIEGAGDTLVDKLIALGVISVLDLEEVGTEPLIKELGIDAEVAKKVVSAASEEAKRLAAEPGKTQAQDILNKEVPAEEKNSD